MAPLPLTSPLDVDQQSATARNGTYRIPPQMKNHTLATLGLGLTTVLTGVVMAHDDDGPQLAGLQACIGGGKVLQKPGVLLTAWMKK